MMEGFSAETGKVQSTTSLRGLMLQMTEQWRKRLLWSTAFCGFWALAACVLHRKIERAKVLIVIERTSEETDYPRNRQFDWCIWILQRF